MFRLTKWYCDVVSDQGTVLIVYAAAVELAGLRLGFASTLLSRPDGRSVERTTWHAPDPPNDDGGRLHLHHGGLALDGTWRRQADPVEAVLLDDTAGRIDWQCLQPVALATVGVGGERIVGRGYVECLTMSRMPASLPFRRLRWGRYGSAAHAAVWIAWEGAESRRWTWLDGAPAPGALVHDDCIDQLGGGAALELTPERLLCDRRSLQVISRHLPALGSALAGPVRNLHERKRLARGALRGPGIADDGGWVIDEVVTW